MLVATGANPWNKKGIDERADYMIYLKCATTYGTKSRRFHSASAFRATNAHQLNKWCSRTIIPSPPNPGLHPGLSIYNPYRGSNAKIQFSPDTNS